MSKKRVALATVKRTGTAPDGTDYEISITIAGLTVNGLELPSEMAAQAVADTIEGAIKHTKRNPTH